MKSGDRVRLISQFDSEKGTVAWVSADGEFAAVWWDVASVVSNMNFFQVKTENLLVILY